MIKVTKVNKIFNAGKINQTIALKDTSFSVKDGNLTILKGPSGSGKSTLLAIIAALLKPTNGDVEVDGKKIAKLPDNFASLYRRDNIGFIFQKFNLVASLSVFENVILPLIPSNLPRAEIENKAKTSMEKFSIYYKKDDLAKNLSGGEQQRVAIARALVNNPKIILADEPTANLDTKLSTKFLEFIKELHSEGKTILIATHDPIFFNLPYVNEEIEIIRGVMK
jgi:putative ABC transport system ATP-binding protein